jgi:hypothetical protein
MTLVEIQFDRCGAGSAEGGPAVLVPPKADQP